MVFLRKLFRRQKETPEAREPDIQNNYTEFNQSIHGENYCFTLNYSKEELRYCFSYSPELYSKIRRTETLQGLADYCKGREFNFCNEEIHVENSVAFLLATHICVPYYDLSEFENSGEFQKFLWSLRELDKLCCSSETPEAQVAAVNDHYKRIEDILSD